MKKQWRLTPAAVRNFWNWCAKKNGFRIKQMDGKLPFSFRLFLKRLEKLGIYTNFSAIVFWNTVYTKFEIGNPTEKSLINQARILPHELKHVLQGKRVGKIRQTARYLFNARQRAMWEAEGYAAQYQLDHFVDGERLRDWEPYAEKCDRYAIRNSDRVEINRYFRRVQTKATTGTYDLSVQECINFLLKNKMIMNK